MSILQKLWHLLGPDWRPAAVVMLGLMLIGMVLETLGIGLVIPALAAISSENFAARFPVAQDILVRLGGPTQQQIVTGSLLILLAIYVIKLIFMAFYAWRQAGFTAGLQASLSQRLFDGYLRQPWTFHLQRNSAQLIRNATSEVQMFIQVSQSALTILAEGFVLLGIGTLLLVIEPVGALAITSVLGLAAWGFYHLTRGPLLRWGIARQHHEGQRIQHLQQGLGGIKDAKLLGREADFITQFRVHSLGTARVVQRQLTLVQLPRLWLELLAVTGLVTLSLLMIGRGKPLTDLLPTLGVFAVAAFRLLPSVNRLISALQYMRYALPVINILHHELVTLDVSPAFTPQPALLFKRQIELTGICYRYPNTQTLALDDVSLIIPQGASIGFIGGSGAGKSTLVDVILGLLKPTSGQVKVDDHDIQINLRGWQNLIGYVPQSIFLTDDSLRRNVAFGLAEDQIDNAAVQRAIRAAQLEDFIASLPHGFDTLVGERGVRLSGGQRQRIGIARALYHDPQVLVLDEATSALDTVTEQGVMQAISVLRGSKTILIVAHRLSTVAKCDKLYRMEQGTVVLEGCYAEVVNT